MGYFWRQNSKNGVISRRLSITVALIFFVAFGVADEQKVPAIKPYSEIQKEIELPTPTKEQFQAMLQKFANELHGKAFREFSEKDFFHGHLIYRMIENKMALTSILYHTQELEVFDTQMRSWWQRYDKEKILSVINAVGMVRENLGSEQQTRIFKTGTVHPAHLARAIAGPSLVQVEFYPIDSSKLDKRDPEDNVLRINLIDKQVFLSVSFRAFKKV